MNRMSSLSKPLSRVWTRFVRLRSVRRDFSRCICTQTGFRFRSIPNSITQLLLGGRIREEKGTPFFPG